MSLTFYNVRDPKMFEEDYITLSEKLKIIIYVIRESEVNISLTVPSKVIKDNVQ